MTQQDLAELCGISAEFLGRIERGRSMPSLPTLLRVVNTLEVSADALLTDMLVADRDGALDPEEEAEPVQIRRIRRHLRSASPHTLHLVTLVLDELDARHSRSHS